MVRFSHAVEVSIVEQNRLPRKTIGPARAIVSDYPSSLLVYASAQGISYYGTYVCQETAGISFPSASQVRGTSNGRAGIKVDSLYTSIYFYAPGVDPYTGPVTDVRGPFSSLNSYSIQASDTIQSTLNGTWRVKSDLKTHWFNDYWSADDFGPDVDWLKDVVSGTQ